MRIKRIIKRVEYTFRRAYWRSKYTKSHQKELVSFCNAIGIKLSKQKGEDLFLNKWRRLYPNVNVDFYRFYSHFIGNDANIVPDDVFHIIIEPTLNSQTALQVYSDKNMFEKLFDSSLFPTCVLRKMEGDFMDKDYRLLHMDDKLFFTMVINNQHLVQKGRLIVKPSVETGGGAGVRLFIYNGNTWISDDGKELSMSLLNRLYKNNFIIQECIEPSEFVKQFNPTSYSTLRIFTYRSVKDDVPHFIGGYLRVGAIGSFKDNIWGGGYACPINEDGTLAEYAGDSSRRKYDSINGVLLRNKTFKIPNWDRVLEVVYRVALTNTPNRLLSFDVMLNADNIPFIIEFNVKHQTVTSVQTLQHAFFGEYTDEIIDYCIIRKDKICYSSLVRNV